ncbi:MAG: MopE-related protein [Deltaproteobacteria bacterium]|nr:MopE-related protein [Myxococcales bacterium]MDP3214757.1 MopE-related protein [Deltaproteobacteria bacterium]
MRSLAPWIVLSCLVGAVGCTQTDDGEVIEPGMEASVRPPDDANAAGADNGSTSLDAGATDTGEGTDAGVITPGDDLGASGDGSSTGDGSTRGDGSMTGDDSGLPRVGLMSGGDICGNGLDDDLDGVVDQDCPCEPDTTQPCYPGRADQAGGTRCQWGTMRCAAGGTWLACAGAGSPEIEQCNGVDDNCDGRVDEECSCPTEGATRSCYAGPTGTPGVGPCAGGTQTCARDTFGELTWGECAGMVVPSFEACNGVDDDCDGVVDEDCRCRLGETRSCYPGAEGTAGRGSCFAGTQRCVDRMAGGSDWSVCQQFSGPREETCNGADDDCDGDVDEDCPCTTGETRSCFDGPPASTAIGQCRAGSMTCTDGRWGGCVGQTLPTAELCNRVDDNCDGRVDEGCLCPAGQTMVYRQRNLPVAPMCGIQMGDGWAMMDDACEARRCPDGQVYVEGPMRFSGCVAPPPTCRPEQFPNYLPTRGWVCEQGCQMVIRFGGVFGTEAVCAAWPDQIECRETCFRHFRPEVHAWDCAARCAGGSAGILFAGMRLCLPCPNPPGVRIQTGD